MWQPILDVDASHTAPPLRCLQVPRALPQRRLRALSAQRAHQLRMRQDPIQARTVWSGFDSLQAMLWLSF